MKTFKQYIAEQSIVTNNPKTKTTTAYKVSEPKAPEPKNWVQSMFKTISGEPKPEPVKSVQPLPQFDKTQSAMPDMDAMISQEKKTPVKKLEPKVGSLAVKQTGYPAAKKPNLAPAESQRASSGGSYKIQAGDNPSKIAKNLGITLKDLEAKNPGILKRAKRLKIGGTINR